MPNPPTVTEVFQHVEPDPDAILEQYGVESPDELVATAARHEPGADPEIDADDAAVDDLFADLEWEFVGEPDSVVVSDGEVDTAASAVTRAKHAQSDSTSPAGSVSGADRRSAAVDRRERRATAETRSRRTSAASRDRQSSSLEIRSSDELELVGPEPTARRVADETFGRDGFVFGYAGEEA